jgi:hypothetical protein
MKALHVVTFVLLAATAMVRDADVRLWEFLRLRFHLQSQKPPAYASPRRAAT